MRKGTLLSKQKKEEEIVKKLDVDKIETKLGSLKRAQLKREATQFLGVGRRPTVYDKLLLYRVMGH